MSSLDKIPLFEDSISQTEEPNTGKHAVRALLDFLHLWVAVLLITAVIIALFDKCSLFVLYVVPFASSILAAEISRWMQKSEPALIEPRLRVFGHMRNRGLCYQIFGAIVILCEPRDRWGWSGNNEAVRALGWVVWAIGIVLFLLERVSKDIGASSWFKEDEDS